MFYIIVKNDINKHKSNILFHSNNLKDCKSKIFDFVEQNGYINRIINDRYIQSYKFNPGFMYNTKNLSYIYEILCNDYEKTTDNLSSKISKQNRLSKSR
jgi:hypothetical protein